MEAIQHNVKCIYTMIYAILLSLFNRCYKRSSLCDAGCISGKAIESFSCFSTILFLLDFPLKCTTVTANFRELPELISLVVFSSISKNSALANYRKITAFIAFISILLIFASLIIDLATKLKYNK